MNEGIPDTGAAGRRWLWPLVLAVVIAGHLGLTLSWMQADGFFDRPPLHDAAWRRLDVLDIHDRMEEDGLRGWLRGGYYHDEHHPPLMVMVAALAVCANDGDATPRVLWWGHAFFAVLLALGTYRLARNFGGPALAVGATAVTLSCPVVIVSLRATLWPQMPMSAGLIWCLDALLRSRCFTRRNPSLAFGVLLGLATLTKMLAPLYVIGSAALALVLGLREPATRKRVLLHGALAVLAAGVVVSTWYVNNYASTLQYTSTVVGSDGQQRYSPGMPRWSLTRWTYYPRQMVEHGFGLPLGAVVVAALVWLVLRSFLARRKADAADGDRRRAAWILAAGVLCAYPLLVVGSVQGSAYYLTSFAPLGAVLVTAWVRSLGPKLVRVGAGTALALTALVTIGLAYRHNDEPLRFATWPVREFALEMAAVNRARGVDYSCLAEVNGWTDHTYMNPANLEYEARRAGLELRRMPIDWPRPGERAWQFSEVHFVVVDTFRVRTMFDDIDALLASIDATGYEARVVREHVVSDTSTLYLVQIRVPGELGPYVSRSALDQAGVQRHETSFDNGWRLVGSLVEPRLVIVRVVTFWEADPGAALGFKVFANLGQNYQSLELPDPDGWSEARPIVARTTMNFFEDPASIFPARDAEDYSPRRVYIGLMFPDEPEYRYADVVRTEMRVVGRHIVAREF